MKTATRYLETHMVRDLATATGGRYRRVRVDDKTLDIEVHAPEKDGWVPVSSLSQGTLDLVYLVARLGLVRLVTGDRRPPLIFDDPFVTLDDAPGDPSARPAAIHRDRLPGHLPDDVAALRRRGGRRRRARRPDRAGHRRRRPADERHGVARAGGHRTRGGTDRTARLNEIGGAASATVLLGLFSAVAWGCGDFGGGLLTRRTALFGVVLISQFVGLVLALVLAVVRGETVPAPADLGWSVLAGIAGGVGISALYQGLAVGRMGIVAPVTGVMAAVIPVAAGIVLEGVPPPLVLVGIALAIVAVVLVSRVSDAAAGRSGLELALLAGVGIGAMSVCIAQIGDGHVFGPLVVIRSTQALLIVAVVLVTRSAWRVDRRLVPAIAGVGILDMAGNGAFILAVQTGALAVAAVLSSLYPVTTVILATVVLRERVTRSHAVGIALAVAAIGCIAAGSAA